MALRLTEHPFTETTGLPRISHSLQHYSPIGLPLRQTPFIDDVLGGQERHSPKPLSVLGKCLLPSPEPPTPKPRRIAHQSSHVPTTEPNAQTDPEATPICDESLE